MSAQGTYAFDRVDSDFSSQGLRCAAWLYRPRGVARPPVLVMAHGFGAEKHFRLPAFAERFVQELGIAVLLFDYRNFGGSEGGPRNLVNPWRHGQDWDAAIAHACSLEAVDGTRIGLWGSSFGGGHVLAAGARHPQIRAIVAQVPFVSGWSSLRMQPLKNVLLGTWHGLVDILAMLLRRRPHLVPIVGPPGSLAAMTSEESCPGYSALVPKGSTWTNAMPARIFLTIAAYSPMARARRIKSPTLLVAARHDSLVPIRAVRKTARRIENCRFVELDCNHFEPYLGEWFEHNVREETAFLRTHLAPELSDPPHDPRSDPVAGHGDPPDLPGTELEA